MKCDIQWNILSLNEWQSRFDTIKRSNLLQSYGYAQANAKANRQRARWGLIMMDGVEAGLVQILEAGVFRNLFHAVMLDRGPLWFEGFGGAAHVKIFFDEFNAQFPRRWGRKRRIIPEIERSASADKILAQCGLVKNSESAPYQTLWWDLTLEEEALRSALKSNWRGSLKKAEALAAAGEIEVSWEESGKFYQELRSIYAADKAVRGYGGASPQLLDNLAVFSTPHNPMIMGKVEHAGALCAFVIIFKHGQSATYQVGWSNEVGRGVNAHHLLLWQACARLKKHGVRAFDLGGINDDKNAAGIRKFKEGTNAQLSTLMGQYA